MDQITFCPNDRGDITYPMATYDYDCNASNGYEKPDFCSVLSPPPAGYGYVTDVTGNYIIGQDGEYITADDRKLLGAWLWNNGFSTNALRLEQSDAHGTVRELQPGRAILLNGTTQYLTGPTAATPSAWSAACWVYPLEVGTQNAVFSTRSGANGWYIGVDTSNQMFVYAGTGGANSGATHFVTSTWQHFAYTYDGTTIRFYKNGALVSSSAYAPAHGSGSVQMKLGWDSEAANYYNARLSAAYWAPGQVLTAAQVLSLYGHSYVAISNAAGFFWKLDQPNSALQQDSSGNGNHSTITNWATTAHYAGVDVPKSWQNDVGFSTDTGTNLIADPLTFNGFVWRMTRTADAEYEPQTNTLAADKFLEKAESGQHYVSSEEFIVTRTTYDIYTSSLNFKPIGRTEFSLEIGDYNLDAARFKIDTTAGTIDSGNSLGSPTKICGSSITNLGGGWFNVKASVNFSATAPQIVYFALAPWNAGAQSYLGDVTKGFYATNTKFSKSGLNTPRNEATPANDVIGNALSVTGRCPARPRLINSHCLTLNGTNQYVTVGTGTWSTDGTQAMTVEGWFKTTDTGTQYAVCNMVGSGIYPGWIFTFEDGQPQLYLINTLNSNDLRVRCSSPFNDGNWHYHKITYDGSKTPGGIAFFVDGVRQTSTTLNNTLTGSTTAAAANACIGSLDETVSLTYNGSIAYLKLTIGATIWEYTMAEGSGDAIYEVRGGTRHLVVNTGTNWAVLQNAVHSNITRGIRTGVNLLKYSEQLNVSATWVNPFGSVTANAGNDPNGAATADQINTVNGYVRQQIVFTNGTQYTISCYAKAVGAAASIRLGTMTVVDASISQSTVALVANTWTRVSLTFTAGLTDDGVFYQLAAGPATALQVWGTQLETGATASTYYATDAANGLVKIPRKTGTLFAANGLLLTHKQLESYGKSHNLCETLIDFTAGVPTAPLFAGQTITDLDDYYPGRAIATLGRQVITNGEHRYSLYKP